LFHPGVARIDCRDCQRRLYDLETGEPKTYRAGPQREIKYFDGPTHKPPCAVPKEVGGGCPKQSPDEAHRYELTEASWATWRLYRQARATGGASLTEAERTDELLAENFATLDRLMGMQEKRQAAREMASALMPLLVRR
jgi:hypothetical protein